MFLLPAFAALNGGWRRPSAVTGLRSLRLDVEWLLAVLVLTLLIGFRFHVGGDWENYLRNLRSVAPRELADALRMSDPGYAVLSWLSVRAGLGIYGVNLFGGLVFSIGLGMFCRSLPRPWLALAVAIPYLVIVVAMGYSRQGIALGLAMLGFVALGRQSIFWFLLWVLLAATFHKTAVVLLPIAALAATRSRYWTTLWVGVAAFVAYTRFLEDSVDTLYSGYVQAQYQSQGALVRILMIAVPAAILLLWRRQFLFTEAELRLWLWVALIAIALLALVIATPATTAVDRIGLYMLPLQLVVFSHVPDVFGVPERRNEDLVWVVLIYYAAVQFVWLNFAANAGYWVPYRFYLLDAGA
ncbi:EpsG family protein [uncultured Thiodictyon sp.]|uniref:EpsG family protein n=1 Tax=uncultured Thiodictyon sp. TaxID=1846217 RepID=UPI0025FF54DD|nr:EpsG family protein [uncultured Thiodictyon sp.]